MAAAASSTSAPVLPFCARNSRIAYATSKAAIVQLTRGAAAELGRFDINVDAIAPGITATAMTKTIGDADALQRVASSGLLENLFIGSRNPKMSPRWYCFSALQVLGGLSVRPSTPAPVQ